MVKLRWIEELADDTPRGEIELRFCSDGEKYMKYIMTFILWIDTTVRNNIYYKIIKESGEFRIHVSFGCDEMTLKKIHNRFRTLVRKYYRRNK